MDALYLRECLDYDPATGLLRWRERPAYHFASQDHANRWNKRHVGTQALSTLEHRGQFCGRIDNKIARAHRVAWAIAHGSWPREIDHINGKRGDNRLANLRQVTSLENQRNRSKPSTNKSGRIGVHLDRGKWTARIGTGTDTAQYLGRFDSFEKAVEARQLAEQALGYHKNHGRAPNSTAI